MKNTAKSYTTEANKEEHTLQEVSIDPSYYSSTKTGYVYYLTPDKFGPIVKHLKTLQRANSRQSPAERAEATAGLLLGLRERLPLA